MGDMNLPRFFLVQKLVNEWRIGAIFPPTKNKTKKTVSFAILYIVLYFGNCKEISFFKQRIVILFIGGFLI